MSATLERDIEERIRLRRRVEALPRVLRQQALAFTTAGDEHGAEQLRLVAGLVDAEVMTYHEGEQWRIAAGAVIRRRAAEVSWTS